ncbi:MAG: glycerol-3-phosphate dehydrogenase/oxidase [Thermoanaerobaculia bacterium]
MFHPLWREHALAELDQPFDLLIVGGGITGCGILLDAAQRGLRVLLVERGDVACGTSSRSSKLIHGGLRYLKQLQFGVTRRSCRERDRMLALSPHLVKPLRFVYPTYRGDPAPGWKVELGLRIYDRLTRTPERHTRLTAAELEELAPELPREGLDRALAYSDARADDARLTLAVAATGLAYGGLLLTRAAPEEAVRKADGRIAGAVVRDLLDGDRTYRVEASLVVNATGAWVDEVRHRFGLPGRRVRPSRGSHLLFRHRDLPLTAAVTVLSPDDRRPVFFIPHPEGVLAGTTDLFHDGPLDDPRPSRAEVDYLLRATAAAFPGRKLTVDDAVGSFAGLRPVLDQDVDEPSKASREEDVWEEDGLLSVAGGKLTTWRATAEQAVDTALRRLPEERARAMAPCATAGTALAGLAPPDLDRRLQAVHGLTPEVAAAMARRLGQSAWSACAAVREPHDLQPIADGVDLCAAEVVAHLRFGGALKLSDLLLRRVRLGMWRPAEARELVPALRTAVCAETGWNAERWDLETEDYQRSAEAWTTDGVRDG